MILLDESPPIVGELVARRLALGLPQWRVAEAAGTNQTALSFWETGARQPTLPNLLRWAGALGCRLQIEVR